MDFRKILNIEIVGDELNIPQWARTLSFDIGNARYGLWHLSSDSD